MSSGAILEDSHSNEKVCRIMKQMTHEQLRMPDDYYRANHMTKYFR